MQHIAQFHLSSKGEHIRKYFVTEREKRKFLLCVAVVLFLL